MALDELAANFAYATARGSVAFADTTSGLYTGLDPDVLANDAVAARSSRRWTFEGESTTLLACL